MAIPLPSIEQYEAIIGRKEVPSLSTLTDHYFLFREKNGYKEYCFNMGTSAAVFKAIKGSQTYAVRCFLRGGLETFERYQQLAAFLASKDLFWKVEFDFLETEILFEGQYYPVVKMHWEDGPPLHQFIAAHLYDHYSLDSLQSKLVELSKNLEENGIGHGDLKYNNILTEQQGTDFILKLIDYDSMFIPAFEGKRNLETGSPGFQPLKRLSSHFSETIDRFSIWVMLATLEAVKTDVNVWKEMELGGFNNEHSLFTASDFFNPEGSRMILRLRSHKNEALNFYLDKVMLFSRSGDLNSIEKPKLYKSSFVPPSHEKFIPPVNPVPHPVEQRKHHDIEIKTVPSGKDVLVHGVKKGITPLRLSLVEKDFQYVEVVNESQKTLVPVQEGATVYELDFSKKIKEPVPPPTEEDEILEFGADKYNIEEGELTTINWKVKGAGKIHISNLGEVAEKTGAKKVLVNRTTNYVLTVGSENRSLTINVQPKTIVPVAPVRIPERKKPEREVPVYTPKTDKTQSGTIIFWAVIMVLLLSAVGFYMVNSISKRQFSGTATTANTASTPIPLFTESGVRSFLEDLYGSYNRRNLSAIMTHYAPSVRDYYDSRSLPADSLQSVIHDLFITPAAYSCTPDFKTLVVQPQGKNCKVVITINEKLKSDNNSRTETYNTKIEYLLDPSYKIISEKNPV